MCLVNKCFCPSDKCLDLFYRIYLMFKVDILLPGRLLRYLEHILCQFFLVALCTVPLEYWNSLKFFIYIKTLYFYLSHAY